MKFPFPTAVSCPEQACPANACPVVFKGLQGCGERSEAPSERQKSPLSGLNFKEKVATCPAQYAGNEAQPPRSDKNANFLGIKERVGFEPDDDSEGEVTVLSLSLSGEGGSSLSGG